MDVTFPTQAGTFNFRVAGIHLQHDHVLIHRNVRDSFWALPGGRIRLNEDAPSALYREFTEELGASMRDATFAFVHENFFTYQDQSFHELGLYFYVDGDIPFRQGDFYGLEGDSLIYRFHPINQLHQLTLHPDVLTQLPSRLLAHAITR